MNPGLGSDEDAVETKTKMRSKDMTMTKAQWKTRARKIKNTTKQTLMY